jgi:hypothetical protein
MEPPYQCVTEHTRVLVTLQHELGNTCVRIPELHATILGATEDPVAVGSESDTKHEVLRYCISG